MAGDEHSFDEDVTTPVRLGSDPQTSGATQDASAVELQKNHTSGSLLAAAVTSGDPRQSASLPDGTLLCERFRIVRFLARGGMGEVYEAEDLELRENVALKTVLPEIARNERAMERFRREISLARKVTAPQICRINDLFRHRPTPGGPPEHFPQEVTFLTMELLRGESLAALIARKKRLTAEEAFPLVKQMAEGLEAAHRVNVIHRDFKSANVMLVAQEGGLRAVVTDFGLARSGDSVAGQHSLTGSDDIVGTPVYMAPEQVQGGSVTASADIYALGVVMYEMVTGAWPFVAETRLGTAMKRLTSPPDPPSHHVADLDPRWERAILRALALKPEDRFAKVIDIIPVLEGNLTDSAAPTWTGPSTWSGPQPAAPRRGKGKWLAPATVLAFLILVPAGFFGYRRWSKGGNAIVDHRPAVAVVGLQNLSGIKEDAWLGTALSEMLSTELSSGDQIRAVSGEDVARMRTELMLPEGAPVSKDNLPLVAVDLGTQFMITGSYVLSGSPGARELRLDLHLLNRNGDEVDTVSEKGTETSLSELATSAGAKLRLKLGATKVDPNVSTAVRATVPSDPQAARLYSEGIARLRAFDAVTARDVLEKAAAIETKSPAIHSALAMAWKQLGYDGTAEQEAKLAFDAAKAESNLPQDFAFGIEARYYELSNQWDKAIDVYSSLRRFYPKKFEYGLRLAAAQADGGKPEEALNTYASLKKEFGPLLADDPRIALGEAEANERLGRPEAQQLAATTAGERAEAVKAKLLQAPALVNECISLDKLGRYDEARKACESGQQIYSVFGDQMGSAWATNNIGNVLSDKGDMAGARAAYEQALAVATKVGAKGHMTGALMNIGKTYFLSGDNEHAASYYTQSLALAKEIGNKKQTSLALNNLAGSQYSAGNLKEAQKRFEESVQLASEMGDNDSQALALSNIALIQTETGELMEARRNYDDALRIWKKLDAKPSIANCLASYAELLSLQGDTDGASKKVQEALTLAQEVSSKSALASVWLSAGQVALDGGQFAAAEKSFAEAIPEFHAENDPDSEAYARAYIARALIRQNKVAEAGTALQPVEALGSTAKLVTIEAQISRAAWMLKSGQVDIGRKLLTGATQSTRRLGFTRLQLEAQLTALEMDTPAKRGQAQQIYEAASNTGYKLLAIRASHLR